MAGYPVVLSLIAIAAPFVSSAASDQKPWPLTAIPLKYANADRIAEKLKASLGQDREMVIITDEESNTIFIRVSAEKLQKAEAIIRRLDVRRVPLFVMQLEFVDAVEAARRVRSLLGQRHEIRVTADERTNSVILSGANEKQIRRARQILRPLDVKDK